jgi:thiamine-phosphate pyrophosphorylase
VESPRLLLITDSSVADSVVIGAIRAVGRGVPAGFFAVQLRDKSRPAAERAAWAATLRQVTREVGAWLVINGDEALARAVEADGMHCPADVAPKRSDIWTSAAAHSDADVVRAKENGASAVLVSPVFASPGKGTARGLEAVESAVRLAGSMSVIALGGVDASRVRACRDAGAYGVAMIRGLLDVSDPRAVAAEVASAFP